MTKTQSTFTAYLDELKTPGKSISVARLLNLSSLNSDEAKLFSEALPYIIKQKRLDMLVKLLELAEENLELNFDIIYSECTTDPDPDIRLKAAEGLGESEDPVFIDRLIALLKNDTDPRVRARAASSLGNYALMGELQSLSPRRAKELITVLLGAVKNTSEDIEVRSRALESIGVSSHTEVKSAIREAYDSGSLLFKTSALYAMGRNCDPVWLPYILRDLSNENPEIRYEAAVACGEIEEPQAVPHLIIIVNDPDHQVRLAVLDALGKIGGPEAKRTLQDCLSSDDTALRLAASESLEYLDMQEDPLSFSYRM